MASYEVICHLDTRCCSYHAGTVLYSRSTCRRFITHDGNERKSKTFFWSASLLRDRRVQTLVFQCLRCVYRTRVWRKMLSASQHQRAIYLGQK